MMGEIRVKPLEWVEHGDQDFVWHRAMPPIGYRYNIEDDGFSEKKHHLTVGQLVIGNFEALDEAKAAAQADYDSRVLSCVGIHDERERSAINGKLLKMMAYFYTNTNRCDLEAAGIIPAGPPGDTAWKRFNHNFDIFILKLSDDKQEALAALMSKYIWPAHSQALPISKPEATKDATA